MVEYLFAFVQFSPLVFFPPWLVFLFPFLSLTCYTLECGFVMKRGFLLPRVLCNICSVSILGIQLLPQILPIISGASVDKFSLEDLFHGHKSKVYLTCWLSLVRLI